MHPDLGKLFFPESVCIIGASRDTSAIGHIVLKNLINGGFGGAIFPVNPKADEILGLHCYPSIRDVPLSVDLAIVVVPAPFAPAVIEECGEKGVPNAIVITAGFRESGEKGRALEEEVLRVARGKGVRIVGPNCMGLYSSRNNLTATFTSLVPPEGGMSFISQSGAVGITMLAWAKKEGIGFSKFISLGNEVDLALNDFLEYFTEDRRTRVITIYMESVKDGRSLVRALKAATAKKPVVVMKVGTTSSGAKAAASHTGALAVEDTVIDGVFRQCGVIRVKDTEELFQLGSSFTALPLPRGRSVAVVSSGGGWGVESSDLMEGRGMVLPPLPEQSVCLLDGILPSYWSRKNPVDMVATSNSEAYYLAVEELIGKPDFDMVFLIGYGVLGSIALPTLAATDSKYAKKIATLVKAHGKPIFVVDVLGRDQSESARQFERAGIPVFRTVRSGVDQAYHMVRYQEYLSRNGVKK
jgi:acetyl coenzyme A synthetase (ADP forming)-like protein